MHYKKNPAWWRDSFVSGLTRIFSQQHPQTGWIFLVLRPDNNWDLTASKPRLRTGLARILRQAQDGVTYKKNAKRYFY